MNYPGALSTSWSAPESQLDRILTTPWYCFLARLHDVIHATATAFFAEQNLGALLLPMTTHCISSPLGLGSDSQPVTVELFGETVYLADSMQFLLELGIRLRPDARGVWYIMPSFRGEWPDERHLSQFMHLEAEIGGGLEDLIALVTALISHLSSGILNTCAAEVRALAGTTRHLEMAAGAIEFQRVRHAEAVALLEGYGPGNVVRHPAGFMQITAQGERTLLQARGGPLWVTHHPALAVPFYQADEPGTDNAQCADLLMGIGETVGAGARHVTAGQVRAGLRRRAVDEGEFGWYLAMKEKQPCQTSGFGIGLERFIAWVCGLSDIRHTQLVLRQRGVPAVP